jgi:hypothetical protein
MLGTQVIFKLGFDIHPPLIKTKKIELIHLRVHQLLFVACVVGPSVDWLSNLSQKNIFII